MTHNFDRRLAELEAATGGPGRPCLCGGPGVTVLIRQRGAGDPPSSDICPKCGGTVKVIEIMERIVTAGDHDES
jgi:hypothetical protein